MSDILLIAKASQIYKRFKEDMARVSIVENFSELQRNIGKFINIERRRIDSVTDAGVWDSYISYEDLSKEVGLGYLILRKGDPRVPNDCSYISEFHIIGEFIPVLNIVQKAQRHQAYAALLVELAEHIALNEHNSSKIIMNCDKMLASFFQRLGYQEDSKMLTKDLRSNQSFPLLNSLTGTELKYTNNKNLIVNVLDPDEEENDWLTKFDEEYKRHKACLL